MTKTPDALCQLEALAVGTLAHVVPFLRVLGPNALPETEEKHRWFDWLAGLFANSGAIGRLSGNMNRHHVNLHGREKAWLKVLAACAFDKRHGNRRSAAVKWLCAEPLESEEVALLRLDQADNEGRGDASAQEINTLSFQRLRGLCQLASYYRPFVFCFDQTEFYASDPALIKDARQLHRSALCGSPQPADGHYGKPGRTGRGRFCPMSIHPRGIGSISELRMEGIRVEGARELITERLKECNIGTDDLTLFFADNWLEQVFDPLPGTRCAGVADPCRGAVPHACSTWQAAASQSGLSMTCSCWRSTAFAPNSR